MQSVEKPARAPRKGPRKLARESLKLGQMRGQSAAPKESELNLQQHSGEFIGRGAGDWPPNTWWP